jgi:hypothetical protein
MYESELHTEGTAFYRFIRDMTVVKLVTYLKGKRQYGSYRMYRGTPFYCCLILGFPSFNVVSVIPGQYG